MGCDIHLFAEQKDAKGDWVIIEPDEDIKYKYAFPDKETTEGGKFYCKYLLDSQRDYDLFGILARVRSLPQVSLGDPRGVPKDASYEYNELSKFYGSDGHSHSFCTLKELDDLISGDKVFEESREKTLDQYGYSQYKKTGGALASWWSNTTKESEMISNEAMEFYIEDNCIVDIIENDSERFFTKVTCPIYTINVINEYFLDLMQKLPKSLNQSAENVRFCFFFDN